MLRSGAQTYASGFGFQGPVYDVISRTDNATIQAQGVIEQSDYLQPRRREQPTTHPRCVPSPWLQE